MIVFSYDSCMTFMWERSERVGTRSKDVTRTDVTRVLVTPPVVVRSAVTRSVHVSRATWAPPAINVSINTETLESLQITLDIFCDSQIVIWIFKYCDFTQ